MKPSALVPALLVALGPLAAAQSTPADYFPAEVGRSWTYTLELKAGGKSKTIEYTTRVAVTEEVEGVGPCTLFVSSSADRLLKRAWFRVTEESVSNPRQQGAKPGEEPVDYTGRVLLTAEALQAPEGAEEPRPTWAWTGSDGTAGTVTLALRNERLYLPKIGDLKDCIALVEKADYHQGEGEAKTLVQTTERTIWLAPGLGKVKEVFAVRTPDGKVTFQTEEILTKFQGP